MSMISELVDTLRTLSGLQNKQHHERIINRAADTIESLSAKLQAANMERPAADCGGERIISLEECIDILKESKRQSDAILNNPSLFYDSKSMVGGCETMKKHIAAYEMAINCLENVLSRC